MTSFPPNFDEDIKSFIRQFYIDSDNPTEHATYANDFTLDAHALFGRKECRGRQEIEQHQAITFANESITSRTHSVDEVFPFGADSSKAMLRGTVNLTLINGKKPTLVWAARASYVKEEGRVRMKFYQVYLDWEELRQLLY